MSCVFDYPPTYLVYKIKITCYLTSENAQNILEKSLLYIISSLRQV